MKAMWLFSLVWLLTGVGPVRAEEPSVSATVDRNQVGVGDVINLTISISATGAGQIEEPNLGPLDGFELINTSTGVETRSSFVNGRFITEQSRNFNYLLAVNKKGTLIIPAIPVKVDDTLLTTKPIQVAVSGDRRAAPPQAQKPNPGFDPFEQLDDMEELFNQMLQRRFRGAAPPGQQGGVTPPANADEAFHIQAETDKTKAFVGEQVVANFYLYTRGQIRDIDTLKYPDLKGFWKEDLEMATRLNFEQVVINGIAYQRALLVSYALFPIKAGKAVVDPYRAKCTVLTPSNFGFGRPLVFTKASKPIDIEVADVPSEGRPSQYTGAVGHFRMTAQFEPMTGVTNQPVTLRVRIEGQGNAKLIELPKLDLPPTFELYDTKSQAKFLKDGSSFKEFEVLIIPREPGVFEIPPIQLATFDPTVKRFTTISSSPLKLTVSGGGSGAPAPPVASGGSSAPAAPSGPELPALATELGEGVAASAVKPGVTLLIYLGVFGFLASQAWTRIRRKPKKVSLGLVLKRRLKKVREHAANKAWRALGVEMTNTIYTVLGALSEQGGANQDLGKLLEFTPPSLRSELSGPLKDLLSQCEALSFAPEKMMGDLTSSERISKLIAQFEKVLNRAIELAEI